MTVPARVKWRSAILESDLSTVVKMVAVALAEFVNTETGHAWPSAGTIASLASCNERSVRRSFGMLRDRGFLVMVRQGGIDGGPTVWKITTPDTVSALPRTDGPGSEAGTPDSDDRDPRTLTTATPDTGSDEPEQEPVTDEPGEGVALVARDTDGASFGELPLVYRVARNQIIQHPEEMDQYIELAIARHGPQRVTDVVFAICTDSRYTYARLFNEKLQHALNTVQMHQASGDPFVPANNTTPIDRPTGNPHTGCTTCNGSTWVTPTDENGDATGEPVYRCPERHLKAVGA